MVKGLNANRDDVRSWEIFTITGDEDELNEGDKIGLIVRDNVVLKYVAINTEWNSNIPDQQEDITQLEAESICGKPSEVGTSEFENCVDNLEVGTTQEKSTGGTIAVTLYILEAVNFLLDVSDTVRFEWLNGNNQGTIFNEVVMKISESENDKVIRYGDTIMFKCEFGNLNNRGCFKVKENRGNNPVYKLAVAPFKFDANDERGQYIVCDESGKCDGF